MEMALYYPGLGYYNSPAVKIGKSGDYYTMPELTNVFGQLLGKQLEEMWLLLDRPVFTIIEYGAGPGKLCNDILTYLRYNRQLYDKLRYCIIERSEYMRNVERQSCDEKVEWFSSVGEVSFECGCVIANEVLDNFAVHRVVMKEELCEIFIDHRQGKFVELCMPSSPELKNYLEQLGVTLDEGCQIEINLQALQWLREVSSSLHKGFVITIDYGYTSPDVYKPAYRNGSVNSFTKQQVSDDLYTVAGGKDITAQVNFSALKYWGERSGLKSCGLTLQSHFLHCLGLVQALKNYNARFYPLVLDMSKRFRVLIMQKALGNPVLTGMQFASREF